MEPIKKQIFIFVNPNSGGQKGKAMVDLKIQHFRPKCDMAAQVQIYNILDQSQVKQGLVLLKSLTSTDFSESGEIHVWSGGGDGTVMGLLEDLVDHKIDINQLYFSCIPFGTGNDFSQALGWGQTIEEKDIVGKDMGQLCSYIKERLEKANQSKVNLDVWDITIKTNEGGYIEKFVKKDQKPERLQTVNRRMCVYYALGVQGWVGGGFEKHRTKSRLHNFFVYVYESMKWAVFKKFPPVTSVLHSIEHKNGTILCSKNEEPTNNASKLKIDPLEIVVQNIPRIWSRDVDLWGEGKGKEREDITNRVGPADPDNWKKQSVGDKKLEVFGIESMKSYIKLQMPKRNECASLIGQFEDGLTLKFRSNKDLDNKAYQRNRFRKFFRSPVPPEENCSTCMMMDGEFYYVYRPYSVEFNYFTTITSIGNDKDNSRLVRDQHPNQ